MESLEIVFDKTSQGLPLHRIVQRDGVSVIGESEIYDKNLDFTPQEVIKESK